MENDSTSLLMKAAEQLDSENDASNVDETSIQTLQSIDSDLKLLPTGNKWSYDEDKRLKDAINMFGDSEWSKISAYVASRSNGSKHAILSTCLSNLVEFCSSMQTEMAESPSSRSKQREMEQRGRRHVN